MARLWLGCWLAAWVPLGCGEASAPAEMPGGGKAGSGGSAASSGGSSGGTAGRAGSSGGSAAGGASELTYFEPGSRLKPKVLASDDGVDIIEGPDYGGWYDSELEFDCFFVPDEAGVERCFPHELGSKMYTDAACTRPVLAGGTIGSCAGLRYRYILVSEGPCAYRGFHVGEELPAATPLFSSLDGSSCQPHAQSDELGPLYELESMPAEAFVRMQRGKRARAPGLDAYVRAGDDGSWQIIGHFDARREEACFAPFPLSRPDSFCLPSFASSLEFAESACQTPTADAQNRACNVEQPTALMPVQPLDTSVCPPAYPVQLYEIDGIRETMSYRFDDMGACVANSTQPRASYARGRPIDLAALPTLETLVVGTGAIRALFSGFGGVPYMPLWYSGPSLLDASGNACVPFEFPDGSLRCIPTSFPNAGPRTFLYEDASCSGAPVVPWFPTPSCLTGAPLPRGVVIPDQMTKCLQRLTLVQVLAVVGKSSQSAFYTKEATTGVCQAAQALSPAPTYLRLGEALPPSEFAGLERTIRR